MNMISAVQTHPGPVRGENQDRVQFLSFVLQIGNDNGSQPLPEGVSLLELLDGVGGARYGYQASHLGVALLTQFLLSHLYQLAAEKNCNPPELIAAAKDAFREANQELWRLSQENTPNSPPNYLTTMALVVFAGSTAVVGSCGDSQVFLFRDGRLDKLTRDHTKVADLLAAGLISPREAKTHPDRNMLSRAMGMGSNTQADFKLVHAQAGDLFVVASDGVTGAMSETELADILAAGICTGATQQDLSRCATRIVNRALFATTDNASVALGLITDSKQRCTTVYDAPDTGAFSTERRTLNAIF